MSTEDIKNKVKDGGMRIKDVILDGKEKPFGVKDVSNKEVPLSDVDIGALMMIENLMECLLDYRKQIVGTKLDEFQGSSGEELLAKKED